MNKRKRGVALLLLAFLLSVALAIPRAEPVNAATPRLNKTKTTLIKGKKVKLKVTGATKKIKWSTNKKKVATVNSQGVVRARGKGTAKITAKVGKRRLICRVTVKAKKKVLTPTLSDERISLNVGKQKQLKIFDTKRVPKWWSTNDKVATVDANGIVRGVSPGECRVYAELPGTYFMCFVSVFGKAGTTVAPTVTPGISGTATPTPGPTGDPVQTQTPAPTRTPTPGPTVTVSPTPTLTVTATPTVRPTQTPSVAPTARPTVSPRPTVRPTQTPRPTNTVAPKPTINPTNVPTPTPGGTEEFDENIAKNNIAYESHAVYDGVIVVVKNNYRFAMMLAMDCLYYDARGTLIGKNSDSCFCLEPGRKAALFALNPYDSNYNDIEYSKYDIDFRCEKTSAIGNANNISCTGNYGAGNLMVSVENKGQLAEYTIVSAVYFKNGKVIGHDEHYADVKYPGWSTHIQFVFPYDSNAQLIIPDKYELYVNASYRYSWQET